MDNFNGIGRGSNRPLGMARSQPRNRQGTTGTVVPAMSIPIPALNLPISLPSPRVPSGKTIRINSSSIRRVRSVVSP